MAYYEFPHTENYDEDLGWLIEQYGNILEDEEAQNKAIEDLDARVSALEAGGGGGGGKNYDKEIADLYSKITTLTTTVTNNKKASDTNITTLTNSLTALTTRVKTLEADNVTNKSKINALQDEIVNKMVKSEVEALPDIADADANTLYVVYEDGAYKEYIVSNISGTKAFVELVSSSGGGGSVVINKITEFSGSYNVGEFYQYAPNNYYTYFYIAISDSILMPLSGSSNNTIYKEGIVPVQAIPCGAISGAVTEMKYIFGYDNGFYARVYTNEVNGYLRIGYSGYLYLSQEDTWHIATPMAVYGAIKSTKSIQANDFLGATIIKATSVPTEPQEYQLYDFGDNTKLWYYDGENWHSLATTVETPIVTANANDAVTRTDSKTESIIYLEEHIVELDENGIPILDKKINTSVNTDDSSLS